MKITSLKTFVVEIPFHDGGKEKVITPLTWHTLENVLVRIEDELGNVGWGEAFGYFVSSSVQAMIDRLISPLIVDQTVNDIPAWNLSAQLRLHIFGRYGVTMFGLSGVDMALWDLKARREGLPLHRLLGTTARDSLPAYASLVRYNDSVIGPATCERALREGFNTIKLHENSLKEIAACRHAIGDDVPLATDVNCSWTVDDTRELLPALAEMNLAWLEEPIFPPEDFATLSSLRGQGVAISAGENWCTAVQFENALALGAVDSIQPSVTKVGGISECLRIAELASRYNTLVLPHSPYFGPGLLATLHLAAVQPKVPLIEYHYVETDGWLYDVKGLLDGGSIQVPTGHGLGLDLNLGVFEQFLKS
ncbi:mandelate racemase/muconate lactonizing enzyme family protein [Pseudomonas sp. NPDC087804]|uniref:mandelate racemase/muconate lactonizing enzyme family protein n=1 Tax=Pseudomonas sp. NPDC087804 TaxID=3364449 RepID=UPI0037FF3FAF